MYLGRQLALKLDTQTMSVGIRDTLISDKVYKNISNV
jgi:hypothetical protein